MSIVVTQKLEDDMKAIMNNICLAYVEAKDLYDLYWSEVSPDSVFTALAGGDAATKSSKLTKTEVTNAVTVFENVVKFIENNSASSGDYMATIQAVIYGNDEKATAISDAIEAYGDRSKQLCSDLLLLDKECREANELYNDSEISAAAGAMSTQTVVFGADMTKDDLVSGQTLLIEFMDLINAGTLTNGRYMATVQKWKRLQ